MDKSIQDTLLTKPKTKAETIFSALAFGLLSLQILSVSAYSIIAPFLPLEFQRKEIPEEVSGYIFGMFSLMVIVASPFISVLI